MGLLRTLAAILPYVWGAEGGQGFGLGLLWKLLIMLKMKQGHCFPTDGGGRSPVIV